VGKVLQEKKKEGMQKGPRYQGCYCERQQRNLSPESSLNYAAIDLTHLTLSSKPALKAT
jgi:hypothetical protein